MKYLIKGVFIFFSWLIFINSLPYDIAEIDFSVGEAWYRMFIASTILFSQASFFDILAVREETLTKKNGAFFVMHVLSTVMVATVYKGNIIKNLIMDCQSYTKYRPNETTGGIFVSWRRKEELPTGA